MLALACAVAECLHTREHYGSDFSIIRVRVCALACVRVRVYERRDARPMRSNTHINMLISPHAIIAAAAAVAVAVAPKISHNLARVMAH